MKVVGTMKPIERISIVDQVINNLKDYIVEQNVAVGDKMPTEKEICEMYGVGRSTAREAYRMMQAIDMIDVKRGKGAYFKGVPSERTDDSCVACWFKEHGQRLTSIWAKKQPAGKTEHKQPQRKKKKPKSKETR